MQARPAHRQPGDGRHTPQVPKGTLTERRRVHSLRDEWETHSPRAEGIGDGLLECPRDRMTLLWIGLIHTDRRLTGLRILDWSTVDLNDIHDW